MQIGVIADTYSKMRPEALEVLEGSDLILHRSTRNQAGSPV
ncbi:MULTISPECIES: metallophosphatase family protein [Marinobacter]|jgi:uncharacterized protein|uniref:Phosphodiesterase n=1 Tax=Marinobacter salarius TaxID=1420917 RepID=A0A1W6K6X2_9GAMM|nr:MULTISPECIES: metallophosphatase family protein [Marinobacter]ARM83174.1 phosphodiesterase [Marinobacter salarius]MCC4283171.1 metallophosphatase family protein [Marinobacter salarius]VVT09043.1 Phosphodiesterase [Marinobacter salarius]VXB93685.1 Phosphodiesterase [Marinobacter salarius]|tara:strand:+ start:472 stop:594 length:123 start_codon:yes stop_codon:yes gene_type:complete